MRAWEVTAFDTPLAPAERATPTPQGREMLVEVAAVGVCHSDLHIHEGFYDFGGGRKLSLGDRGIALPLTMGHEIAGTIVAVGPQADDDAIGRKCVVYPWIGCGTCPICKRGEEQLCGKPRSLGVYRAGGYATHVLVPDAKYCIDLGTVPAAHAAPYACSGLTTYGALKKIEPWVLSDEPILIIGAGGLGLMSLAILKAMGGRGAIVADIDPAKREAAIRAGAIAAIDPADPDVVARLRNLTGGGLWATIDLVASGKTLQLAIDASVKGAQIVLVGLIGGEITMPTPTFPLKALTVRGSYTGSLGEFQALMALVRAGKVAPIPTAERPLADVNAVLADLKQGRIVGRTVMVP